LGVDTILGEEAHLELGHVLILLDELEAVNTTVMDGIRTGCPTVKWFSSHKSICRMDFVLSRWAGGNGSS